MTETCAVDGCDGTYLTRGWCRPHYMRWYRHGDPLGWTRPVAQDPKVRFQKFVSIGQAPLHRPALGACHLWTGVLNGDGYGFFRPRKNERGWQAHRWAFTQAGGVIPTDYVLDHLCRVRACVNPLHLEPVTNAENLRRGLGWGLRNGMRSKCRNGHEYTPENSRFTPEGWIRCRTCQRQHDKAAQERRQSRIPAERSAA